MRFEVKGASIKAVTMNPRRLDLSYHDLSDLSILPPEDLMPLLDLATKYSEGKLVNSTNGFMNAVLRPFGRYLCSDFAKDSGALPKNFEDWLFLTHQFGLWYISHEEKKSGLAHRIANWQKAVCPWLRFLQEEGWLPLSVVWPSFRLAQEAVELSPADRERVLGEPPNQSVNGDNVCKPIDKTIAGPIFWLEDAEYLDRIETTLRERDNALGEALLDYWVNLVRDYRTGKKMLACVVEEDWLKKEKVNWRLNGSNYLVSPSNNDGHMWALRFLHHKLHTEDDAQCLTRASINLHPAVSNDFLKKSDSTPIKSLLRMSSLSDTQSALFSSRHIYNRFLGVLNNIDFSVAIAILIREHPNLNSTSLAGAKLINGHGKYHLVIAEESASIIFSVDKPRARSRKYAVLSRKAAQVIKHLIRVTFPLRMMLKRIGNPHWRYLFLGDYKQGSLGHPATIRPDLLCGDGSLGVTLSTLYPNLSDLGLVKGTVTFAKIRNTKGVIEWFDTGSVHAVAKRLGNNPRTVIEHYIPASLILAWNERIIRRFQNTLIVLASRDEHWILDVVDMPNMQELNSFLAQLVLDFPIGSSPIADRVHQYFGSVYAEDSQSLSQARSNSHLHVRLSVGGLGLLLAYRSWAINHLSQNDQIKPDLNTGITPKHFVDLAGWVQAIANSNEISEQLRESFDVARLKKIYQQAISLVPDLIEKILLITIDSEGAKYDE